MPRRQPTVSRRRLLVGASAIAALGVTAATSAGCGTQPPPPDLDDLTTALDRARADSELAARTAATTRGPIAATLNTVAAERSAHADALADEIVRLTGRPAPSTSVVASTTTTTSAVAAPAPTVDDVIGALRVSADSATTAATALSGYRAGLLASIAAACTSAYAVALVPVGGKR